MNLYNLKKGVASAGDLLNAGVGLLGQTGGNVFYVDSGVGADSGNDGGVDSPFATVDFAVGKCSANSGDVILVKEGHNETITSATSLVLDVAGVTVLGAGSGHARPTFDFDNTAGSIEMDAANCRLSNVILRASVTAVVIGINVDAHDVELDNLEFTWEATGDDFITMVDVDAFDRAYIHDSLFTAEAAAGCAEGLRLDDCHNVRVVNNWFSGQFSDAAIVGEGALGTDLLLAHNMIYNADTTDANGIALAAAFTGLALKNSITSLDATGVHTLYDPGSMLNIENYVCNAIDEAGIVTTATASA